MIPTAKQALEAELAAYKGYLEKDDLPSMIADALHSVITCGCKYLETKFGQPGVASGSSIIGADLYESMAVQTERRLVEVYELVRACRTTYINLRKEQDQKKDLLANMNRIEIFRLMKENKALKAIASRVMTARGNLEAAQKELEAVRKEQRAVNDQLRDLAARQAAAVAAAGSLYQKAKAEYREATMATATIPARQGNIFEPMVLNWPDAGLSSHGPTTARFEYLFVHDPTIVPAVRDFQEKCQSYSAVAEFVAPPISALGGTNEERFTQHIIAELGPRLKAILEGALSLQLTRFRQLGRNWGVDIELVTYMTHAINPIVAMPVEVKRNFGGKLTRYPAFNDDAAKQNFELNEKCLSQMCESVGGRNQLHVWYALTQAMRNIEQALLSSDRGVIIARDGVVLLTRTCRNMTYVSEIIPYEGINPHPAAAIAFWIGEVLDKTADCGSMHNSDSRYVNTLRVSGLDADCHRMTTQSCDANMCNIGLPLMHGSMPTPVYGEWSKKYIPEPKSGYVIRNYGSGTASTASDSAMDDPDNDPLTDVVYDKETLTFERYSRCGYIYRAQLKNGQHVIIKAAPTNNIEILNELRMEVHAYHRLRDLQGTIVPRVFSYGYATIDGDFLGILAIEFIDNGKMMSALDMDQRMELKNLTDAEKTACLNALGAIHKRGVIHGDIRGANLIFRSRGLGNNLEPVFIDFGFAQLSGNATKLANAKTEDYFRLLDTFKGISQYA
ncbi:hypothetical protein IW148_005387 [Coemansia sp. RSA 1199]|nr:hypothetical protein IW148_005387 [Coemansia sp. RSA 1199]